MIRHPVLVALLLTLTMSASAARLSAAPGTALGPATNEPPAIIFSTRPALLVTVNGPPRYNLINGTSPLLWRVVNTRVLLLKNAKGRHFLRFYDGYLEAESLNGPWRVAEKVPQAAGGVVAAARASGKTNLLEGTAEPRTRKKPSLRKSAIPWICLSTVPAELVLANGVPDFIAIPGTRLFSARNTTADLFWLQGGRTLYLLAAGRWYRAESYEGPWEVVPDDGLPPDFRELPETGATRRVRALLPPVRKGESRDTAGGSAWLAGVVTGHGSLLMPPSGFSGPFARPEVCR